MTRRTLETAVPAWAIVTETGNAIAPFVGIWRIGATVYLATPAESDAAECVGQLADFCADASEGTRTALAVHAIRFDAEDRAARYMRDVRRMHRASGQSDKVRRAPAPIPGLDD